jgi:hypothetical protein
VLQEPASSMHAPIATQSLRLRDSGSLDLNGVNDVAAPGPRRPTAQDGAV